MLVFKPPMVDEIFHDSRGIPRMINILCDRMLIKAYLKDTNQGVSGMISGKAPSASTRESGH